MAIEIYQEVIPFSNQKTKYPISENNTLTNPIVMPLSFDTTSQSNTVETVLYIRNNDKDVYYSYVYIGLMMPIADYDTSMSSYNIGKIEYTSGGELKIYNDSNSHEFSSDIEIITSSAMSGLLALNTWNDGIVTNMLPYSNRYTLSSISPIKKVKFSYGYNEVSEYDWINQKKDGLIIQSIGSSSSPDISYIPVRMRIYLNGFGTQFTLNDYSLNIAYGSEGSVS